VTVAAAKAAGVTSAAAEAMVTMSRPGGGGAMAKTRVEVDLGRAGTAESDPGQAGGALEPSLLG
jgi:hypothetical protein